MLSGTEFEFRPPAFVSRVLLDYAWLVNRAETDEIRAQCESNRALCLACRDGMVVVELRPWRGELELFVWVAIAFRHGAVKRQLPAIERIARELNARTIAFGARRRGWARRLGSLWHPRGNSEFYVVLDGQQEQQPSSGDLPGTGAG